MKSSQIIGWLIWVKARLELIKRDTEQRVCTSKLEESSHPLPPNPLQVGVSWNWGVFHPSAETVPNQRCDWTRQRGNICVCFIIFFSFFPAFYSAERVPRKANPPPNPPLLSSSKTIRTTHSFHVTDLPFRRWGGNNNPQTTWERCCESIRGKKSPEKTRGGMRWRWWRWWWRWWCAPGLLSSISTFPPQCAESDSAAAAADTGSEGAGQGKRAARIKADREREREREACRWGPMLWLTGTPTHTFCLRHIIYPMRRVTLRLLPLTLHWPTVISCDLWMCGGIKTLLTPAHYYCNSDHNSWWLHWSE